MRLPISSSTAKVSSQVPRELLGPHQLRAAGFGQLHRHRQPRTRAAPQRPAGDVVHVQPAPRVVGADVPLGQREHGAFRDHEHAAQLGQPRDHVMRHAVAQAAAQRHARRAFDKRHHRQ
jgi:hypothetical protein